MNNKLINNIKTIYKLQDSQILTKFKRVQRFVVSIFLKGFNEAILVMLFGTYFPENNELNVKQIYLKIIKDLQ